MKVSIDQLSVGADCGYYPSGEPGGKDAFYYTPFYVSFEALYDNSLATFAQNAQITYARLLIGSESPKPTWEFVADPSSSGSIPAGVSAKVVHFNEWDSGQSDPPELDPCLYCGSPAELELDLLVGTTPVHVTTETPTINCYADSTSSS